MRKKLTDRTVTRTPPSTGRVEIWDTVLPAFGIRISSTGKRTWMVAMRRPGKNNPARLTVGTLPPMSLAEARASARAMMARGVPAEPVKFKELAEEFLQHGRTRKGKIWRPATDRAYRTALFVAAEPLHGRRVHEIRRRDIADLLRTVSTKRGPTFAALTRATLGRFWSWLVEIDRADYSPVIGTPIYEIGKRERVLSDAELRAIWAATDQRSDFNMILRLMLWTGCRRSEAGGMRWSELGDANLHLLWTVPGERTKNHRPLALPLPRQAVAALDGWHRFVGRDLVFGRSANGTGFSGWSTAKAHLDARLRFNQDWGLHDCRRTVETRMAGLGIPKEHVNKVLNHAAGPVTTSYDRHTYLPEKRAALQTWADDLERIVAQGPAKIVALR
jgi:integrase